jgi:Family of unknown function (DUF5397)
MPNGGFQEAQAQFQHADVVNFVGQVRRFGQHGPAYEVTAVRRTGDVAITVIQSGEQLDYALTAFLADPIAEIVP